MTNVSSQSLRTIFEYLEADPRRETPVVVLQ